MATDYTPNVGDITAPTSGHPPYRVFDEIRLVKERLATVYASYLAMNASVTAAQLAQSLAELARDAAAISKDNANNSAIASAASALAASLSEAAASASAAASANSEAAAKLWATAPHRQEVITGSGLYSALHWATEAAIRVATGVIDDAATSTNTTWSSSKVSTELNGKLSTTGKAADSDLLDGMDSSVFSRRLGNLSSTTIDFNTLISHGTYHQPMNAGTVTYTNHPTGLTNTSRFTLTVNDASGDDLVQIISVQDGGGANRMWKRHRQDITWLPWIEIWTSATGGSGSGLDADLLDGQQGSWYANLGQFANSLSSDGYQRLPNGLIIQWGTGNIAANATVTFPLAFPTTCLHVNWVFQAGGLGNIPRVLNRTNTSFQMVTDACCVSDQNTQSRSWFAIGY